MSENNAVVKQPEERTMQVVQREYTDAAGAAGVAYHTICKNQSLLDGLRKKMAELDNEFSQLLKEQQKNQGASDEQKGS